jgi:hypothetical protein
MPTSTETVRPFPRDLAARPKGASFPVQIAVHEPMETAQKVPVQLMVNPSNGSSVRSQGTAEQAQFSMAITTQLPVLPGRSSPALPHGRILDLLLAVEGR